MINRSIVATIKIHPRNVSLSRHICFLYLHTISFNTSLSARAFSFTTRRGAQMDNQGLVRRLKKIRDVAGSVAVGTVGGSVAAVSTVLPSAGGAIGTRGVTRTRPRLVTISLRIY